MKRLELRDIHKRYGSVSALRGVSLSVQGGEIVALLGDNGAGKSTLAKVMAGAVIPDAGSVLVDGSAVALRSPGDAVQHGIEMIYQDLALVDTLDIASNMFLGQELRRPGLLGKLGLLDKPRMRAQSSRYFSELDSHIGPVTRPVEVLSRGQRQALAVARSALRARAGTGVVIMDEPTASLGVVQTRRVGDLVRQLHTEGVLVVLISHNLPLCFQLATRMVVLRHGSIVADEAPAATSLERIVAQMTGTDFDMPPGYESA